MIPLARVITTVPVNGTDAVHRITIGGSPTTGTFRLTWNGYVSGSIAWSATNNTLVANIQTGLDAIFGAGNTTAAAASLTAGVGTIDVTFGGSYGRAPQSVIIGYTTVGETVAFDGTIAIASQTTGVMADYRGASAGAQLIYTGGTYPVTYINTSNTLFAPNWKQASTTNALTAHAGGGQGSALALTAYINRVTTVGTAADSVKLPSAKAGASVVVINAAAANAMNVFPTSGDAINALAADAALSVAANKTVLFVCAVDGTWNSIVTA